MIICTGSNGFVGKHVQAAVDHMVKHPAYLVNVPPGGSSLSPSQVMPLPRIDYDGVIHLAGISDTTCANWDRLKEANVKQTLELADSCCKAGVPFVYASSASVYGNGRGALNHYAESKSAIDASMANRPGHWYGARFFNVYGKGDEAKGDQASIVTKAVLAHRAGKVPSFFTPEAKRDYVHVSDVVNVLLWFLKERPASGIYDVGTGQQWSIKEVCQIAAQENYRRGFIPLSSVPAIAEIPVPAHMVGKCQMDTKADLTRLRAAGYDKSFLSLEEGIKLL